MIKFRLFWWGKLSNEAAAVINQPTINQLFQIIFYSMFIKFDPLNFSTLCSSFILSLVFLLKKRKKQQQQQQQRDLLTLALFILFIFTVFYLFIVKKYPLTLAFSILFYSFDLFYFLLFKRPSNTSVPHYFSILSTCFHFIYYFKNPLRTALS